MTRRLLWSYLSITVFVLILLELPLAIVYGQRERDRFAADTAHDATVLASFYEDALERSLPPDPGPARAYQRRTDARVVVVDRQGLSVVDSQGRGRRDFSTRPEIREALAGEQVSGTRRSDTLDTELLYVAVPVASGGVVHGAVRLTLDTHLVTGRIHRFWVALVATAVVVLAAVAAVGWVLAASVTRPVRALRAAAGRFARGDLAAAPPPRGAAPELRELSAAMNQMARRLGELLGAQRAFVADASHQLRTPLTSMRLRLENLQSGLGPPWEAEVESIIDEADRLTGIVADLLRLARAEEPAEPVTVDLRGLTEDRVDTWTAVAGSAGIALRLSAPSGPVLVSAVPGSVEQVLDNLLDNAVDAAPDGSTISVTVERTRGGGRLTVADTGPGLDDDQKSKAQQRFWRADASGSGTGLGLAIVAALVASSGGTSELSDTPGGGLTVTIDLPAAT